MKCPQCGVEVTSGEAFCDNCGADLVQTSSIGTPVLSESRKCPRCGNSVPLNALQCESCGMDLRQAYPKIPGLVILRLLGQGGMSNTYLAHLERDPNRQVAVKMEALQGSPHSYLEQEVEVLRKLDHPGIISVYPLPRSKAKWVGKIEHQGQKYHYILLKYMPGGSLEDKLRAPHIMDLRSRTADDPLSLPNIESILNQVTAALDFMHGQSVVHLDLKPSNILFSGSGRQVVITDFGLAEEERPTGQIPRLSMGTPGYSAPEILDDKPGDARSDIYALGVILAEMLLGRPLALRQGEHRKDFQPINQLPKGLQSVIRRAIADDPEQRHATATALFQDFQRARSEAERTLQIERQLQLAGRILRWPLLGLLALVNVGLVVWLLSTFVSAWLVANIAPFFSRVPVSPTIVVLITLLADAAAYLVYRLARQRTVSQLTEPTGRLASAVIPRPTDSRYHVAPTSSVGPSPITSPISQPARFAPAEAIVQAALPQIPDSIPLASLMILRGQKGGIKYALSSTTTSIGRDATNEIVLADPTVSLRHAKIVQNDGEFILYDLGSSNGTFVNSDRVVQQSLQDGDYIVVGGTILQFRFTQTHTKLQQFRDTWSAYVNSADQEDSDALRTAMIKLASQIAAALDVPVPPMIAQTQWCSVYDLDTDVTFAETLLPQHLPIVFSSRRVPRWDDVEQLRKTLASLSTETASSLLVLVVPTEHVEKTEIESLLSRAQSHSIDVVVTGQQEFRSLLIAQDPRQAFRHLVLGHVRLRSGLSPYVATGPTTDNMFFGRSAELRDITEHADESSFAVIGGRRIGKTSLLQRLHRVRLPGAGFYSAYHDCSLTPTLADFKKALIREWRPAPPGAGVRSFADVFDIVATDRPLVLLLDEADKLVSRDQATQWEFFSALRGLANMNRVQVVLSGERSLRSALRDPTSPLFNFAREILLGPLDFNAVRELVIRPLNQLEIDLGRDPQLIVNRIYQFTSGHPNVVQRLCRRLLDAVSVTGARRITLQDVEAIIRDPDFQREDFLYTFWEAATPLEKLISLLMCDNPRVRSLRDIQLALSTRCSLHVKNKDVDDALQQLVDLRSLLRRTQTGYDFAVEAFPLVIAGTVTMNDQIEILVEEIQENHQ